MLSRFRSDSRWGFFPSASVGWNIAREKFFLPVSKVVNTFKVRASYGSLGNQNTSSLYPTYSTIGTGTGSWIIDGTLANIACKHLHSSAIISPGRKSVHGMPELTLACLTIG
ncbi:TonB-dependent receptor [Bacteroides thetaiotaomicron]|nr:TonB-dependent receptor [Bacteroides thetaiotaomicron]